MKQIKQKYYELVIFPQFMNNIKKVLSENNIIMRVKFEEEKVIIYYIVDNKLLKLEKFNQKPLSYSETSLENIINFIELKNLPEFLQDFKLNAEIVSSQNLIDFISNTFKEAVSYYKFTRKEYEQIFEVILKYNNFFKFNTPALVIHNEDIKNKWID